MKTTDHRPSKDIEKDLHAAQKRLADVRSAIADLEKQVIALKEEERGLIRHGYKCENGAIPDLIRELNASQIREKHQNQPAVVWARKSLSFISGDDCVVDKVTAKLIFVCSRGSSYFTRFKLDGESVSSWKGEAIDIRKTFGIDADSVPPNFKC